MHFISLSIKITTIIRVNMCVKLLNLMLISMSTFTMGWHASKAYHISMHWNASEYPGHDSLAQPGWWKLS